MDDLGNRMKLYEGEESDRRFIPTLPICCRLDGKCFSSFTKGLNRPYDKRFTDLMVETTLYLVEETNACVGYTQSDEISLIYYSEDPKSQVFFDGRIQKMCSVLASMCSVKFNQLMRIMVDRMNISLEYNKDDKLHHDADIWFDKVGLNPIFDCRVWIVPSKVEAVNNLVWREQDCLKNSITMAAREYYSDNELFKKNGNEKQEMLHQKGVNWNDYPYFFKRGTYIQRKKVVRKFTTDEISKLPEKHEARSNPDLMVERTQVDVINMPPITKVVNRIGVIFNGEAPIVENNS